MSLGPLELALILGIALLLFGPARLPGLGRSLGDAIRGFKKGIEGQDEKSVNGGESDKLTDGADTHVTKDKQKDKSEV